MGFEPTTSSLGSWHSTTELRPHDQTSPSYPPRPPPARGRPRFSPSRPNAASTRSSSGRLHPGGLVAVPGGQRQDRRLGLVHQQPGNPFHLVAQRGQLLLVRLPLHLQPAQFLSTLLLP